MAEGRRQERRPIREQTMLITGATGGIGREVARALGRMGCTLVVSGRDAERTRALVEELRGAGNSRVSHLLADLSRPDDVRRLAHDFKARHDRLDVLINNAGAIFSKRVLTPEGHELTWALNHLGYYLLTHELMGLLLESAPSRVVSVASDAHRGGSIHFDDPTLERYGPAGWKAYQQSKFANVVFSVELSRRLQGTGVSAFSLHPGFVASRFATNNGVVARALLALARPLQISTEKGAETVVYAATSPDLDGRSGEYLKRRRAARPDPGTQDPELGRRLWERSATEVGVDPRWPTGS